MNPYQVYNSEKKVFIPEIYNESKSYFFAYARYALLELLSKIKISSIYIPSFICRDILAPINKHKIEYFFYEVDNNLNPILEDIDCDAILSVNYFGFEQNTKPFIKYKEKYNALFIEDNAHGFLSKSKEGSLLGTRGDFGLLSIRKTVFLPNGAALLVNNDKYKNIEFNSALTKLTFEDEKYNKKLFLKKLFISRHMGLAFVLIRRLMRYIRTGSSIPLPDKESENELPSNEYITPVLNGSILNIDIDLESNRRSSMYRRLQKYAALFNIKPIFELYDGVIPYEFAFIDNGDYEKFENYLLKRGYFILPWPDLPDEVVDNCPEFYKSVKVVPFLW